MIDIQIDDREVRAALDRLQRRLSDLSPVMKAIATELEARVEQRFETATDPQGRPWKPLAPSTLAAYLARGKGNRRKDGSLTKKGRERLASRRPLYDTGDLLGSLTSSFSRSEARVGFGQPYAAFHEYGTKRIPRRGLLMADPVARTLGDADRAAVLDILGDALRGALDGRA
ncbi:phage virion morphogenesis protein [Calidifontimicrobium sp. SYSU G02091]|uniref:phage virion morphogenesis protein n=1 Tax=Calidifontimicrobium sp. SYSU G02091 TaxID=2926421 RepID=UPI001F52FE40|nr:phage virion morphogenesis protein [Calidifontimicrobium sp. SYSU G02091]MCI1193414.1 phage virion morphogenesis protein [Calidifontimicrobium sp. SYSU G02091]